MTEGTAYIGGVLLEVGANIAPLRKGMAEAYGLVDKGTRDMDTAIGRRMSSVSRSLSSSGSAMTKTLTVPILGVAAATAKMAADFDRSMELIHTQAGASQKQVDMLKQKVLDLAKAVPFGPQVLSEGLYHLESIGLRGAKAMSALKVAADGAAVGHANLEQTATALGSAWLVNIKGAGNFQQVMGTLNAAVGVGNMRMGDLVASLGTGVLPMAKRAGLSLQDILGALAVFSDEGYKAYSAATQMGTALHYLYDPTNKATGALAEIGLKSGTLAEDMHKPDGLLVALRDLQKHLDDTFPAGSGRTLTVSEMGQAVNKFRDYLEQSGISGVKLNNQLDKYKAKLKEFGTNAVAQESVLGDIFPAGRGRVLSVLMNQLNRYQFKLGQIQNDQGKFGQDVKATMEQPAVKAQIAWSSLQAEMVDFGQKVLPDLLTAGTEILHMAEGAFSAFNKLPSGLQHTIITGGLILAGVGPAMKVLGLFTGAIAKASDLAKTDMALLSGKGFGYQKRVSEASNIAGAKAAMEVAEMTVGTLVVKEMLGGGAGGGFSGVMRDKKTGRYVSVVPTGGATGAAEDAATTAESAAPEIAGASMLSRAGGMLVGGLGTAAIAAIAAPVAFSLVKKLAALIGGPSFGQERASKIFSGGFGGTQSSNLAKETAKALDTLQKFEQPTRARTTTNIAGVKVGPTGPLSTPVALNLSQLSGRKLEEAMAAAHAAGVLVAKTLEAGWNQYKFQSEPVMISQLRSKLKTLPPSAQAAAVASALKFSEGLEKEGRLTKGSTARMLGQLEQEFPHFAQYLGIQGRASLMQFNKALDFTQTEAKVKTTLRSIGNDFAPVQDAMSKTEDTIAAKTGAAVKELELIAANGTGPMRRRATADLAALRASTETNLTAMASVTQQKIKQMVDEIGPNLAASSSQAGVYMGQMAQHIIDSMKNGTIATGKGMNLIIQNLNKALNEMGQKQLKPIQVAAMTMTIGKQTQLAHAPGGVAATGGIFPLGRPGTPGRDTIPMSIGGHNIVAGEGETVIVANRHQTPILNARLAKDGGLPGFFKKYNRPNYMASGGIVTASDFGGPGDPTTGSVGYKQDNLYQHPDSYAELDMGTALGNLPYLAPLDVTYHGKTAKLFKRDIGLGGPGIGGHPRAIDLWFEAARALGFSGLDLVNIAGQGKVNVTIKGGAGGSGGGGTSNIKPPHVSGPEAMADIARGALKKVANAANQYADSHMAVGTSVGVQAGPTGPLPQGVGTYDGKPVDKWIIPILQWASAHGWHGSVNSGYRSPSQQLSAAEHYGLGHYGPAGPLGSNHVKPNYPGGAVDVTDPPELAAVLKRYPGRPNLVWGEPVIGDYVHFSATGHARGGVVSSGQSETGNKATIARLKRLPKHKKGKTHFLPPNTIMGLAGGGAGLGNYNLRRKNIVGLVPGFDPGLVNSYNRLKNTTIPNVEAWQGYLQNLYPDSDFEALVTMSDGTQVVNWNGMIDPSTGQFVKGINQRLGEIGTQTPSMNTLLGVDETLLGDYISEYEMAEQATKELKPWLKKMNADYAKWQRHMAADNSVILRTQMLQERMPKDRSDRTFKINERFKAIRHRVSNASTKASFSNSSLTSQLLAGLASEETAARLGVPTRIPKGWKGGAASWSHQAAIERAGISSEFRERRQAIEQAARARRFQGQLSRSNALFALTSEEDKEKHALTDAFDTRTIHYRDTVRNARATLKTDTANASAYNKRLTAVTGTDGLAAVFAADLSPYGDLNIAKLTEQNITIPGWLQEINTLKGTNLTQTGTTPDNSALVSDLETEIAQLKLENLVAGAQSIALANLPPFGGSYWAGGVVPGPPGAPRTVIAHGGEEFAGVGNKLVPHVTITQSKSLADLIDVQVTHRERRTASVGGRPLPGRGGGRF